VADLVGELIAVEIVWFCDAKADDLEAERTWNDTIFGLFKGSRISVEASASPPLVSSLIFVLGAMEAGSDGVFESSENGSDLSVGGVVDKCGSSGCSLSAVSNFDEIGEVPYNVTVAARFNLLAISIEVFLESAGFAGTYPSPFCPCSELALLAPVDTPSPQGIGLATLPTFAFVEMAFDNIFFNLGLDDCGFSSPEACRRRSSLNAAALEYSKPVSGSLYLARSPVTTQKVGIRSRSSIALEDCVKISGT
jgi:hypothetical protein